MKPDQSVFNTKCHRMWKSSVVLFVLSILLMEPAVGKVVNPCAVAYVFVKKLGATKQLAAKWVCLAKFASGFNTMALGQTDKNGNDYFGLFQINDSYCKKGTKKSCGVSCTELVSDDILPSATCALNIYNKEGGFSNWPAWKNNCQNLDPNRFINNCDIKPK